MTDRDDRMPCWVYRSSRKEEMFLYLSTEDGFDRVPQPLLKAFGRPTLVIQLELHPQRKLAREDVHKVMANLRLQGFHLQMPPELKPELYEGETSF